jgi:hypothetical protein
MLPGVLAGVLAGVTGKVGSTTRAVPDDWRRAERASKDEAGVIMDTGRLVVKGVFVMVELAVVVVVLLNAPRVLARQASGFLFATFHPPSLLAEGVVATEIRRERTWSCCWYSGSVTPILDCEVLFRDKEWGGGGNDM